MYETNGCVGVSPQAAGPYLRQVFDSPRGLHGASQPLQAGYAVGFYLLHIFSSHQGFPGVLTCDTYRYRSDPLDSSSVLVSRTGVIPGVFHLFSFFVPIPSVSTAVPTRRIR